MPDIFDIENPALNADGTLKEAHEIEWVDSPSKEAENNILEVPDSPTLNIQKIPRRSTQARLAIAKSPMRSGRGFAIYKQAVLNYKMPSERAGKQHPTQKRSTKSKAEQKKKNSPKKNTKKKNNTSNSESQPVATAANRANLLDTDATEIVTEQAELDQLLEFAKSVLALMPNEADDSTEVVENNDDPAIDMDNNNEADNEDGDDDDDDDGSEKGKPKKKKAVKKSARADVLTFCRELDEDDFKFQCLICSDLGRMKTKFNGNLTTMRRHCAREGTGHYRIYVQRCVERRIPMHDRCMPDSIRKKLEACEKGAELKQSSMDDFTTKASKPWSQEEFMLKIVRFIAECNQSFNVVESEAFRDMILYARGPKGRESDIPHRTKVSDFIDELGDEVQQKIRDEFKKLPPGRRISLTFDAWTSATMIPFLGITAHYIDADWKLRSVLLFFGELSGSHSGENIAKCIYNVLVEYGIVDRLLNITSDNVSVNDKAMFHLGKLIRGQSFSFFDEKQQRSHCFAHAVALAYKSFITALSMPDSQKKAAKSAAAVAAGDADDGEVDDEKEMLEDVEEDVNALASFLENESTIDEDLKSLKGLLLEVRAVIARVRRSPQAKSYFAECCKRVEIPVRELLPFCNTRWETWRTVLERYLELKDAIIDFLNTASDSGKVPKASANQREFQSYKHSSREWTLLRLILDVINESARVQQAFSSEKNPSIPKIFPAFLDFREKWASLLTDAKYAALRPAITKGVEKIEKYETIAKRGGANVISLVLTPTVKDVFLDLWDDDDQLRARARLEHEFDVYLRNAADREKEAAQQLERHDENASGPSTSVVTTTTIANSRLQALIQQRQHKESTVPSDPRQELHLYLNDALVPEHQCKDELLWWRNNSARYPVLSEMAANYLAIQASSVPCERLFSSAGLVDTKRRNRLGAERFGAVEYIKAYFRHMRHGEAISKNAEERERKRVRDENTLIALDINKRTRTDEI